MKQPGGGDERDRTEDLKDAVCAAALPFDDTEVGDWFEYL